MLSHVGLDHYFGQIVGADRVDMAKPDPEMLMTTLSHFNFNTDEDKAYMIGDNAKDIEAGSRAGCTTVFVTWGFCDDGSGDHMIDRPQEFLDLL